jgi:hypothetical protein
MERFYFELIFDGGSHIEINALFAPTLTIAMEFFDDLYLELHRENTQHPSAIRLRPRDSDEELALYAMHCDAVVG